MGNNHINKLHIMKVERTDNYIKVTAEEGMYLTRYEEGDDIKSFNGFKSIYIPPLHKVEQFHEIEDVVYEQLNKLKKEYILNGKNR